MWIYWSAIASCFLVIGQPLAAYDITNQPFSELIETIPIAQHFLNLTVHHDLYKCILNGSLPMDTFKAFLQQGRLYLLTLLDMEEITTAREGGPERPKLSRPQQDVRDMLKRSMDEFLGDFGVPKTNQMTPDTLDLAGKQFLIANYDDLMVVAASVVSFIKVTHESTLYWKAVVPNPETPRSNPYKKLIAPVVFSDKDPQKVLASIDGNYARLNGSELAVKQRMLDVYTESMELYYRFTCEMLNALPIPASAVFTDMTPLILPEIQGQVINHPLYTEIALGTLPLETYKALIQQDYLYMRGFFKTYEYMERKEADLNFKESLRKQGQNSYDFFESEFKQFNFGPAAATASQYLEHDIRIGRDRPVEEGVATLYPCYFLWLELGAKMNEIAAKTSFVKHPYQTFLDRLKSERIQDSVDEFKQTLNRYYNSTSLEGKYRMLQAIRQSIFHELEFANGVYGQRYHF